MTTDPNVLEALPDMAETTEPILLPGLTAGLGLTKRQAPRWFTNPDAIQSFEDGFLGSLDEFNPETP